MTLLPLLIGAAMAGAPLRTDWLQFSVQFGVQDGQTGQLTQGGAPWREYFEVRALQVPEGIGWTGADYVCALSWTSPSTTPVDSSDWPELWPGAAWRVDTDTPPTSSEACARLDPARFGSDPVATFAEAGWYVGFGPLTPAVAFGCGVDSDQQTVAVAYAWMEGARPLPIGTVEVNAADADGEVGNEGVPGASSSPTLPTGGFSPRCGFFSPS